MQDKCKPRGVYCIPEPERGFLRPRFHREQALREWLRSADVGHYHSFWFLLCQG